MFMFIFMIIWKNELLEIFPFSKWFQKLKVHNLQKKCIFIKNMVFSSRVLLVITSKKGWKLSLEV